MNNLRFNLADDNVAVGYNAQAANTSGTQNNALGHTALDANQTGNQNTAVGNNALGANTGSNNTAVGSHALASNIGAGNNTGALQSIGNRYRTAPPLGTVSLLNGGKKSVHINQQNGSGPWLRVDFGG